MRRYVLSTLLAIACTVAHAEPEVEALVALDHTSNIMLGRPFNDEEEWQSEFIGAGITINAGRRRAWEIDIVHGAERRERETTEQASKLHVRFYPGRVRE